MVNDGDVFSCEFVGKLILVEPGPAMGDHLNKRIVADVEIERDATGYGRLRMKMRIPRDDKDCGSLSISNNVPNSELVFTGERPVGFR